MENSNYNPGEDLRDIIDTRTIPIDFYYEPEKDLTIPIDFDEQEPGAVYSSLTSTNVGRGIIIGTMSEEKGDFTKMYTPSESYNLIPLSASPSQDGKASVVPGPWLREQEERFLRDRYKTADESMIHYIRKRGNIWGPGNENNWKTMKDEREVREKISIMASNPHDPKGMVNDNNVIFFTRTVWNRSPLKREEIVNAYMENISGGI